MRVALVHDFLTQVGGAERVLQCFHELFPDAPIYTLVYDQRRTREMYSSWNIRTSFLQNLPGVEKRYKWYLPLMPRAIEAFDFSGYDLVLSDSSAFAKGIKVSPPTVHLCYCHTPTRYLWGEMDEYISYLPYNKFARSVIKLYLRYYLQGWDLEASARSQKMIANSKTVQERIYQYYGRDSTVIYPPVDTDFFVLEGAGIKGGGGYYFTAARLEPYKKISLVAEVFEKLGLPLKIAGDGTQSSWLSQRFQEAKNIELLGRVSDEELRNLYRGAKGFVFPALEDAGIMVLEALSCGTPVIGLEKGGTAEFVRDGENGVLFAEQSEQSLTQAVKRFEKMVFTRERVRASVTQFDRKRFKENILRAIKNL